MRIRNKRRKHHAKHLMRKLFLTWFDEKYEITLSKPYAGEDGTLIVAAGLKERARAGVGMTNFGSEVRRARIATGTTLKQLADFTGKGAAYHNGLEVGDRRIGWNDVYSITEFFRSRGHLFEFKDWYELAKEANSLPLRDFEKEVAEGVVFDCPAGRFDYE